MTGVGLYWTAYVINKIRTAISGYLVLQTTHVTTITKYVLLLTSKTTVPITSVTVTTAIVTSTVTITGGFY